MEDDADSLEKCCIYDLNDSWIVSPSKKGKGCHQSPAGNWMAVANRKCTRHDICKKDEPRPTAGGDRR